MKIPLDRKELNGFLDDILPCEFAFSDHSEDCPLPEYTDRSVYFYPSMVCLVKEERHQDSHPGSISSTTMPGG